MIKKLEIDFLSSIIEKHCTCYKDLFCKMYDIGNLNNWYIKIMKSWYILSDMKYNIRKITF